MHRHAMTVSRYGTVASMGPVRAEVMWQAVVDAVQDAGGSKGPLDIVDLGGGTGGAAVRLAEQGHRLRVVDPSPDALASLHRRSSETGVEDLVTGIVGDADDLGDHVEADSADLVLCHGVLEIIDDPHQALSAIAATLRANGRASIVVAGRLASVLAKALSGDFAAAEQIYRANPDQWDVRVDGPRRYSEDEIVSLMSQAGLYTERSQALRVFVDLVPSAMVDSDPGSRAQLFALEQLVKEQGDFGSIAGGIHAIARLD